MQGKICPVCGGMHQRSTILCDTCYRRRQSELNSRNLNSLRTIQDVRRLQLPFTLLPFRNFLHDHNEAMVQDIIDLHGLISDVIHRTDNLLFKLNNEINRIKDDIGELKKQDLFDKLIKDIMKIPSSFQIKLILSERFNFNEDPFFLIRLLQEEFLNLSIDDEKSKKWNADQIKKFLYYSPDDSHKNIRDARARIEIYAKVNDDTTSTEVQVSWRDKNKL